MAFSTTLFRIALLTALLTIAFLATFLLIAFFTTAFLTAFFATALLTAFFATAFLATALFNVGILLNLIVSKYRFALEPVTFSMCFDDFLYQSRQERLSGVNND